MTTTAAPTIESQQPDEDREVVVTLLARAQHLRAVADGMNPVVAKAYRRRAAELTLAAWAGAVRQAPVAIDTVIEAGRPAPHLDAA
ncbi:MAG: hypothetical protein KatS3mg010_2058 [Acidimicrobiia bacterium]|nr:MAG: hypothetical protein KatS3mg010_2058 [Acidimicrobiia bacterium]